MDLHNTHQDDWALFCEEVSDVKPIEQDIIHVPNTKKNENGARLRAALNQINELEENQLTTGFVEAVDPYDIIAYKKEGVQDGVFKSLRQGKYRVESTLNISKLSVEAARLEVFKFITQSHENNIRCVLLVHGLGLKNKPHPARLKSYINAWLPNIDLVLACHSATTQLGSYGATIVLLKKSAEKKRETRERIQKRLG
ncbi:DNA endonuclease SmrA [Catenovulum sediminis]|uniref:DNA endonuclease SmrA n=1 Tax=Catenovulum sediminis TaxID=1740262 RepID=UPI00117C1803|nr:DNA endonuclease SmrA [Catenovulum sediminis]